MNETKQFSYSGEVLRTKIIKTLDPTLVFLKLKVGPEEEDVISCLVAKNALTFLLEVKEGDHISIHGHLNAKGQHVVDKYLNASAKANQMEIDAPDHLKYPHKKD